MPEYNGIKFAYSQMRVDVQRMAKLARRFLTKESKHVFDNCQTDLENIRNATALRVHTWAIPTEQPLKTRISNGEYQNKANSGSIRVYGELSFVWQIVNPDKASRRQDFFHLNGIASTKLIVKNARSHEWVAQWQFEAGDATSPGCHFHSAVNQYDKKGMFPEWLKIPRLPNILFTPMDALEFLLGEIFQLDWHQSLSERSEERDAWGNSQRARLEYLLKWQLKKIAEWETSPWMSLKKAKPNLEVICGK